MSWVKRKEQSFHKPIDEMVVSFSVCPCLLRVIFLGRLAPISAHIRSFFPRPIHLHLSGWRSGILTVEDYYNLCQCESLEDLKLHLSGTDYGSFLQNEKVCIHLDMFRPSLFYLVVCCFPITEISINSFFLSPNACPQSYSAHVVLAVATGRVDNR